MCRWVSTTRSTASGATPASASASITPRDGSAPYMSLYFGGSFAAPMPVSTSTVSVRVSTSRQFRPSWIPVSLVGRNLLFPDRPGDHAEHRAPVQTEPPGIQRRYADFPRWSGNHPFDWNTPPDSDCEWTALRLRLVAISRHGPAVSTTVIMHVSFVGCQAQKSASIHIRRCKCPLRIARRFGGDRFYGTVSSLDCRFGAEKTPVPLHRDLTMEEAPSPVQ